MWTELRQIVAGIANPHLKALARSACWTTRISRARYRRAPAAKQIHHAYLGGLMEHVLSLCWLARMTAPHYPFVDCDLLLTGVVLHDIGKIYELNYERGFSYSSDGQLLGHINIALRMLAEKLRGLPEFPPRLRTLVEHMILATTDISSSVRPSCRSFPKLCCCTIWTIMDSKMECMRALIENDRQVEGCFTSFNPALERSALKKDRFLDPAPAPARAARPAGPDFALNGSAPEARAAVAPRRPRPIPCLPPSRNRRSPISSGTRWRCPPPPPEK